MFLGVIILQVDSERMLVSSVESILVFVLRRVRTKPCAKFFGNFTKQVEVLLPSLIPLLLFLLLLLLLIEHNLLLFLFRLLLLKA